MTSVEHNPAYVNKYRSRYIHAPIVNGWYNVEVLKMELPYSYDLLLVDGPVGSVPRAGFIRNIALFNVKVPIIIDDTWQDVEKQMAVDIAAEYGHELVVDEFWSVLIPFSPPDCSAQSVPTAEAQNPTP